MRGPGVPPGAHFFQSPDLPNLFSSSRFLIIKAVITEVLNFAFSGWNLTAAAK